MKIKPISRSIKATALTNPNPSFVSQVKAGANQKPWRAVKMDAAVPVDDQEIDDMKRKPTQKTAGSVVVAAIAPKGYGVMQFEFAKSDFVDEAAVTAWMDAGGYTDYTIGVTKSGFQIENDNARFQLGSVSKIDGFSQGVSAFVGKLTSPEEDEDENDQNEDAEAGNATETAKAASDAIAAATSPSVVPAARTRADGEVEPVVDPAEPVAKADAEPVEHVVEPEPQTDAEKATAIIVRADHMLKAKGVYEATHLGEIVNSLGWIVYDAEYTNLSETTVTKIKDAALMLLEAFMQAAEDAADELKLVFKSAEERALAAPIADLVIDTPIDIAALVATEVAKAIAPLEARTIKAERVATEASERAVTAERSLSERVEADNARGQTRKGADDPVVPESTSKGVGVRSQASRSILSSFGSRHARQGAAL